MACSGGQVDTAWRAFGLLAPTEQEALGPDWVTTTHHSAKWVAAGRAAPRGILPAVTRGNPTSAWIASRGRRISVKEIGLMQGVILHHWKWPRHAPVAAWLGNAMAVPLVYRILRRCAHCATGDPMVPDVVTGGEYLEALTREAANLTRLSPRPEQQTSLRRWMAPPGP